LAALFWINGSSSALGDVEKLYFVAKRDLILQELLNSFTQDGGINAVKQWVRNDPAVEYFDKSFDSYQAYYQKLFHMENSNAPALLTRALGLKQIADLTNLIRDLVLEPSRVRDQAKDVVKEFENLNATHNELEDAKARQAHLTRLPGLKVSIDKARSDIQRLKIDLSGLPVYLGEIGAEIWQNEVNDLSSQLEKLAERIGKISDEIERNDTQIDRLKEQYMLAGGDRLNQLKVGLDNTELEYNRASRASSEYQEAARRLNLDATLSESSLNANIVDASQQLANIDDERANLLATYAEAKTTHEAKKKELQTVNEQIQDISGRPDSNIDLKYQQLRDTMLDELGLNQDDCMFVGELIEVKHEETRWQGAIERALGMRSLTLAVNEDDYPAIIKWLNARHTGLNVRVQRVEALQHRRQAEFKPDGFLRKLSWRDHTYRDWAKHFLVNADLSCISSTQDMKSTPFSMTIEGSIQYDLGRFEKRDSRAINDVRSWNLGFSNKARLAQLQALREQLSEDVKGAAKSSCDADTQLGDMEQRKALLKAMTEVAWNDINVEHHRLLAKSLREDYEELLNKSVDLQEAKDRLKEAKAKAKELGGQKEKFIEGKGSLNKSLENAQRSLKKYQDDASLGLHDEVRDRLKLLLGEVSTESLGDKGRQAGKALQDDLGSVHNKESDDIRAAERIISSFRAVDSWKPKTADWGDKIDGIQDYLDHLQELETEALPELIEDFKARMKSNATESLASIQTRMEDEREEIGERIDMINSVMYKTEFAPGTYLRLKMQLDKLPEVKEFEAKVRRVLNDYLNKGAEECFLELKEVINELEEACNNPTTMKSLRLLDSRYRLRFVAEEVRRADDSIKDVLGSSSGKSGGEKESFAGVIIAASLAYVLTPDGYSKPVYATVFLDEAFSKTAETLGSRVLNVFKELNLHVNMITPFKSINMAAKAVNSLILCKKDPDIHRTDLIQMSWEEYQKRQKDKKLRDAKYREAEQLIDIEDDKGNHE
jgi:uncharacterized protein YPO0396